MSIEKSVQEEFANPGSTLNYKVVVKNIGSQLAGNVVLKDFLAKGFTYDETDLFVQEWELGDILPGFSEQRTYQVKVGNDVEPGFYVNTAEASAKDYGPFTAQATIEVRLPAVLGQEALPELEIEKTVNKNQATSDSYLIYTIEVANKGQAPAVKVVVEDNLPEDFIEVQSSSNKPIWSIPLLKVDENWRKIFIVYIQEKTKTGTYENIARTFAENHPEPIQDKAVVEVIGKVLGEAILPKTAGASLPANFNRVNQEENNYLAIPKIGVHIPIVEGENEKESLEQGAWHLPGTSSPDAAGNTVLTGHRFRYKPPHQRTFYLLDKLVEGDITLVFWQGKEYRYKVISSKIVEPTAMEVIKNFSEPILTLITCHPLFSDKKRLVVRAELME